MPRLAAPCTSASRRCGPIAPATATGFAGVSLPCCSDSTERNSLSLNSRCAVAPAAAPGVAASRAARTRCRSALPRAASPGASSWPRALRHDDSVGRSALSCDHSAVRSTPSPAPVPPADCAIKRRVVVGARHRVAGVGQLGVDPGVDLAEAVAGQPLVVAQQHMAQLGVAFGDRERDQQSVDQCARRERVARSRFAAEAGGQRPQPAVDDVEHVAEAALERLDHRLADQLRLQFVVGHQCIGIEPRDLRRAQRPVGEVLADPVLPAPFVTAGFAAQDGEVGQLVAEAVRRLLVAHAPAQFGVGRGLRIGDQRHQPRAEATFERIEQLCGRRCRTAANAPAGAGSVAWCGRYAHAAAGSADGIVE